MHSTDGDKFDQAYSRWTLITTINADKHDNVFAGNLALAA